MKPRASSSSRTSVIGANRTRWKGASQPASLPPWPAGSNSLACAFHFLPAPAATFWSASSRFWRSASRSSSRPTIGPVPATAAPPSASWAATIPIRPPRSTPPTAGSSPISVSSGGRSSRSRRCRPTCGRPSSPPRTSASTSTTASTGCRVFGAIKNNIFKFRVAEGFSTITMQLARNLWPEDISGRDKSLRRKLREAQVAREIEAQVFQGQDSRALSQPDRSRQSRVRRRSRPRNATSGNRFAI